MFNRKRNDNIEDIEIEIEQWKSQNLEKVEIVLFPGEEDYLVAHGYTAIPLLFKIKDKHFYNMKNCPNFIKEKSNRKNHKLIRLKKSERKILDDLGIEYESLGFILYL